MFTAWSAVLAGGSGLALCFYRGARVDAWALSFYATARRQITQWLRPPPSVCEDLLLTSRLISCLRAGISLDAALESAAKEPAFSASSRMRFRRVLEGLPTHDFLSHFLSAAIKTGTPALTALQGIEKALVTKRRLTLRAQAVTGQSRAQAEVLSWLPWALASGIAVLDPQWFAKAALHPLSWFLWAIAVGLSGLGRQWTRFSLQSALQPKGQVETIEESCVPDLTLRLIAGISQGVDIESACEESLRTMENNELTKVYRQARAEDVHRVARLKSLLAHAARTGAPVRDELLGFLADLHAELEARWEERVQRLPIAMLAPLFVCFFPSSLLVLSGLLLPLLFEAL